MKNGENLMKNKKWYAVIVAIVLVLGGVFFVVSKGGADSMDGTYYWYSSDNKGGGEYSKSEFVVIKGDTLNYTSDSNSDDSTAWKLDKKNKTMSYGKVAEYPYTYTKDVFSFNGLDLVKKDSKTYNNCEEIKN